MALAHVMAMLSVLLLVRDPQHHDGNDCGLNCLFVAMLSQRPEVRISRTELSSLLGVRNEGNTFSDMKRTAEALGFHSLAVETSLENISARTRPFACIAHLSTDHFVLISDIRQETVAIVDPPRLSTVPASQFVSMWSGKCLLISNGELESEEEISGRLRRIRAMKLLGLILLSFIFTAVVIRYRRKSV